MLMAGHSAERESARESMDASGSHDRSTLTVMRDAYIDTESQADHFSDRLIVQSQATIRNWHSMQPVAAMWRRNCCQSGKMVTDAKVTPHYGFVGLHARF